MLLRIWLSKLDLLITRYVRVSAVGVGQYGCEELALTAFNVELQHSCAHDPCNSTSLTINVFHGAVAWPAVPAAFTAISK